MILTKDDMEMLDEMTVEDHTLACNLYIYIVSIVLIGVGGVIMLI